MKGCLTIFVFFPLGILAFLFMWPAFIIIIPLWCIMMVIPTGSSSQAPASAPQKIICPNCGKSYHESFTYCPYCKTQLVQPTYTGNRYERALSAFWNNLSISAKVLVILVGISLIGYLMSMIVKIAK